MSAIQHGGISTPTAGFLASWRLWWKHRDLVKALRNGEVLLNAIPRENRRESIFPLMGELTSALGGEIALRTSQGLILRLGVPGKVNVKHAKRVIGYTHTNGKIGISSDDYLQIFFHPKRAHRSTIIMGPKGLWRRYTSRQEVLGGNF